MVKKNGCIEHCNYCLITDEFGELARSLFDRIDPTAVSKGIDKLGPLLDIYFPEYVWREILQRTPISSDYVRLFVSRTMRLNRVVRLLKKVIREDRIAQWLTKTNKILGASPARVIQERGGITKIKRLVQQIQSGVPT